MPKHTVSRRSARFTVFAFGIACWQIFAGGGRAQDIEEVVVLPTMPNTPVVVPAAPNIPVVVPSISTTPVVVVPILSSYVFPRYQSEDVLTQRNDNNRTGAS